MSSAATTSVVTEYKPENAWRRYEDIRRYFEAVKRQTSDIQRKTLNYLARCDRTVTWREIEDHFGWEPRTIHRSFGGSGAHSDHTGWPTHLGQTEDGTWVFWMDDSQARAWLTLEQGGRP